MSNKWIIRIIIIVMDYWTGVISAWKFNNIILYMIKKRILVFWVKLQFMSHFYLLAPILIFFFYKRIIFQIVVVIQRPTVCKFLFDVKWCNFLPIVSKNCLQIKWNNVNRNEIYIFSKFRPLIVKWKNFGDFWEKKKGNWKSNYFEKRDPNVNKSEQLAWLG